MTQNEQQQIRTAIGSKLDEQSAIALSKRIAEWAKQIFGKDGQKLDLDSRGIHLDYRVAGLDKWEHLDDIYITQFSWETNDDTRRRVDGIKGLFYWKNLQSSNKMGDVTAVRWMPFIRVNSVYQYKEDETTMFECTDTGKRRKWNHLDFRTYADKGGPVRDYHIIRPDIHKGDNLCWLKSWHFSLADDVPCPVEPIIVDYVDDYKLVLRYRDKLYTLSMELGQPHSVTLEDEVPVKPTHNWNSIWLRPPYKFTLVLDMTWQDKIYSSSDKQDLWNKPQFVRTSNLPSGVRTREQIDHDAWEEAVRSGALNQRRW